MDGVAPRTTPFIEKLTDVRRIYLALPEPLNVAYAMGALAGLRATWARSASTCPQAAPKSCN
ncbi:MAG TPA: hypothetical protein VIH41_03070 [Myxococcales bacterium]